MEASKRVSLGSELDGVSVVIPTLNRAEVLEDTLKDLLAQDFENYEIIVVDQSDRINEVVLELLSDSSVPSRYFKAENFKGLPQARNFGWQHANYEVVIFIDDDIRTSSGFVEAHYRVHAELGAGLVAGGIDEAGSPAMNGPTGIFNRWTATPIANFSSNSPGPCEHVKGCNFSVRTSVLRSVGGFDESLSVGAALYEELETALRIKARNTKIWFEPSARLTHLAAPMGGCRVQRDWPRYMFGLSHNRAILIFRHLKPWHRPTAILRLFLLGISYSRLAKSFGPFAATFRGLLAGRNAAKAAPLNVELVAHECITS